MSTSNQLAINAQKALSEGRFGDAIPLLRQLLANDSDDGELNFHLGQSLEQVGDINAAIECYRTLSEKHPKEPTGHGLLGMALTKLGRDAEALVALEKAAKFRPDIFDLYLTLGKLKLRKGTFEDVRAEFDQAVAIMNDRLAAGHIDNALVMENQLYSTFVQPVEDEDHAEFCFSQWRDNMRQAGLQIARQFTETPAPIKCPPTIGFFIHHASTLAHVTIVLDYLEYLEGGPQRSFIPRLYVMSGMDNELEAACSRLGIAVVFAGSEQSQKNGFKPLELLLWLKEQMARDGVDVLVWASNPMFVSFGAALNMAPIQIFWAQRYHAIHSPDIKGYLTVGSCFEAYTTVHGRDWRVVPLAVSDLKGDARTEEAAQIRTKLGNPEIVLGTLARTEKMYDPTYLEAIGKILKTNSQALFIWAGKVEDPKIKNAFVEMGVTDQTRFVGWVDTKLFAQVIDIFLDTAPTGCGVTAMEAMAWGRPLIAFDGGFTMWSENVAPIVDKRIKNSEVLKNIERIFALGTDQELLFRAKTAAEYSEMVSMLINNPALRHAAGHAGQEFTERYLTSCPLYSKLLAEHLEEIIVVAQEA